MGRQLGLELADAILFITSNGEITARRTIVKSVRICPIEIGNVQAVVKGETTPCDELIHGPPPASADFDVSAR
jgi:predicted aspartyl protease